MGFRDDGFRRTMARLLRYFAATGLLITALSGDASAAAAPGFLEGHLKIEISRGAELADENAPKPAPPYGEYPLVVLNQAGGNEVARIAADKDGHYRIALPPGEYLLDVKGGGRRHPRTKPRPFKIVSEQTAQVDMEIAADQSVM